MPPTTKKTRPKTAGVDYEIIAYQRGLRTIIGIDEAGYGAWAGPVVAGAVCLPPVDDDLQEALTGVRDSKLMTARQRERLSDIIRETALTWGVGHASHEMVDSIGIRGAARVAMQNALNDALARRPDLQPDCLFLDGLGVTAPIHTSEHLPIKYGDRLSLTIASASVLAKVWRDDHMRELHEHWPDYGFAQHKGYGTPAHRAALNKLGVCAIHRRSYRPIRECLEATTSGRADT